MINPGKLFQLEPGQKDVSWLLLLASLNAILPALQNMELNIIFRE